MATQMPPEQGERPHIGDFFFEENGKSVRIVDVFQTTKDGSAWFVRGEDGIRYAISHDNGLWTARLKIEHGNH